MTKGEMIGLLMLGFVIGVPIALAIFVPIIHRHGR